MTINYISLLTNNYISLHYRKVKLTYSDEQLQYLHYGRVKLTPSHEKDKQQDNIHYRQKGKLIHLQTQQQQHSLQTNKVKLI